jgi:hypothetical protein
MNSLKKSGASHEKLMRGYAVLIKRAEVGVSGTERVMQRQK